MPYPNYTFLDHYQWQEKMSSADLMASPCNLCPRQCGVDRMAGQKGFCRAGNELLISSAFPHHGEEPPLSGTAGSGTVFFSCCTLKCRFCQNYQISHLHEGEIFTVQQLADRMLSLQKQGCHNINFVTPTHFLPWIVRSLHIAANVGLSIPIVYNCGGYETVEVVRLLEGLVDIYLPDMKYGDDEAARAYSAAPDYVRVNHAAIRAMFRQVGPLKVDAEGIARWGMCIRHLVLPNGQSGSDKVLQFLVDVFDPADIAISLMAQYKPVYRACEHEDIGRSLLAEEYGPTYRAFRNAGFEGFYQSLEGMDDAFLIDFTKRKGQPLTGE